VIISIRSDKLPNPEEIGNAGSFFKNPYVCHEHFDNLKGLYPTIPSYPTENPDVVKLAAGWLIEQA
jgi:UDP-N-acetylmuramate dehydrogenase